MGKYYIDIDYKKIAHAGSKAPMDAMYFLRLAGFKPLHFSQINTLKYLLFPFNFFSALRRVHSGDQVVFQFPVHSASTFRVLLKLAERLGDKGVKRVALVHDVDFGRSFGTVSEKEELDRLNHFDELIVHSPQMVQMLEDHGCHIPCRVLGLFDYRVGKTNALPRVNGPKVVFAGNLGKSRFVSKLPSIASDKLQFSLYGIGGENVPVNEYVTYNGVFSPDDLSGLDGSWGLVWDGPETTSCAGAFGEYLKFNSPHKASLYICAGLPLIVPSGTAVADIVRAEGLGLVVDSLDELALDNISDSEYESFRQAVTRYSKRLMRGANLCESF